MNAFLEWLRERWANWRLGWEELMIEAGRRPDPDE